jgi:ankyrin repeat protein
MSILYVSFVVKWLWCCEYQRGCTALIEASEKGHTATVKVLVEAGANLSLQDKVGR